MQARHPRHYEQAIQIIGAYSGSMPFPLHLKAVFRQHKNWGSKDRKAYRELCYLYWKNFRLIDACDANQRAELLKSIDSGLTPADTDPYNRLKGHISQHITIAELSNWLHEPAPVYLYVWDDSTHEECIQAGGTQINASNTWMFPSGTDLQGWIDRGIGIIQDIASTQVIERHKAIFNGQNVWDCCAGAGGKAFMIQQLGHPKHLLCTDKRSTILDNLVIRFRKNNKEVPEVRVLDLSQQPSAKELKGIQAQVVLADVPCTGSGTWRRNPEVLAMFNEKQIAEYAQLQYAILSALAESKHINTILYCTCSLFRAENEDQMERFLEAHSDFRIIESGYAGDTSLKVRGDYLFSAILKRN
jgi:16S rRNA (cytosine967-C5)-methyltransferase